MATRETTQKHQDDSFEQDTQSSQNESKTSQNETETSSSGDEASPSSCQDVPGRPASSASVEISSINGARGSTTPRLPATLTSQNHGGFFHYGGEGSVTSSRGRNQRGKKNALHSQSLPKSSDHYKPRKSAISRRASSDPTSRPGAYAVGGGVTNGPETYREASSRRRYMGQSLQPLQELSENAPAETFVSPWSVDGITVQTPPELSRAGESFTSFEVDNATAFPSVISRRSHGEGTISSITVSANSFIERKRQINDMDDPDGDLVRPGSRHEVPSSVRTFDDPPPGTATAIDTPMDDGMDHIRRAVSDRPQRRTQPLQPLQEVEAEITAEAVVVPEEDVRDLESGGVVQAEQPPVAEVLDYKWGINFRDRRVRIALAIAVLAFIALGVGLVFSMSNNGSSASTNNLASTPPRDQSDPGDDSVPDTGSGQTVVDVEPFTVELVTSKPASSTDKDKFIRAITDHVSRVLSKKLETFDSVVLTITVKSVRRLEAMLLGRRNLQGSTLRALVEGLINLNNTAGTIPEASEIDSALEDAFIGDNIEDFISTIEENGITVKYVEVSDEAGNTIGSATPSNQTSVSPSPTLSPSEAPSSFPSLGPSPAHHTSSPAPTEPTTNLPTTVPHTEFPSASPTYTTGAASTGLPTKNNSAAPTAATKSPSPPPSLTPSGGPTGSPTTSPPSSTPTMVPTSDAEKFPTNLPTEADSVAPTLVKPPSPAPTLLSSHGPTRSPTTTNPSSGPTPFPTKPSTSTPTKTRSFAPTFFPTKTRSAAPSLRTRSPTVFPSRGPTGFPTSAPSLAPTQGPTSGPTASPTTPPSSVPTLGPTSGPTRSPTRAPSSGPTLGPTSGPTRSPTSAPSSFQPTLGPTFGPSVAPTRTPTSAPSPPLSPTATSWVQVGSDIVGPGQGDKFGSSLSLSADGTRVVIGAYRHSGGGVTDRGLVRIVEAQGNTWQPLGSDILGDLAGEYLGFSVAISSDGNRVAVGITRYEDKSMGPFTGQVKVLEYQSGSWQQLGNAITGEAGGDRLGRSVSLSENGSILAVSAVENDGNGSNSGHVRVYEYSGGGWVQLGDDIDGEAAGDESGQAISLSNDGRTVAISAQSNDDNGNNSGHVRIFSFMNGGWGQLGQDLDGVAGDKAGRGVSLSADGGTVAVGSHLSDGNGENSGKVRIFTFDSTNLQWVQVGSDLDGEAGNQYGFSMSLSADGSVVAIGGRTNDSNGKQSGRVRVLKYTDGSWRQVGENIDGEASGDQFGFFVSLSADGSRFAASAPFNGGSGHVRVFDSGINH